MVTKITRDVVDFVTRPVTAGIFQNVTLDSSPIGATTPSTGVFTTLGRNNVVLTGGAINGTPIGASVASTGRFTNLTVTGTATFTGATLVNFNLGTFFPNLPAGNGYTKFPNGIIMQWATGVADPANGTQPTQTINWPLSFPTGVFAAYVSTLLPSASITTDHWYQTVGAATTAHVVVQRQCSEGLGSTFTTTTTPVVFGIGN